MQSHESGSLLDSPQVSSTGTDSSTQVSEYSWSTSRPSYTSRKTADAMFSYAVTTILDDTICKLEIIASVINEKGDPSWKSLDFYKPPEKRFVERSECESDKYTNKSKCKRYSCLVKETLKACLEELSHYETFDVINKVVKLLHKQDEDGEVLRKKFADNNNRLEELRKALRNINSKSREKLNKKGEELHRIREAYEEKLAYSQLELNYLKAYEDNRCYLRNFSDNVAEQKLREEAKKYKVQIMNENRVHSEIVCYLEDYSSQVEDDTKNWITKYDEDEERLDQEISEAKEKKYNLELQHLDLERRYRQRCREIDEWLAKRKQIGEEEEALTLRNQAATIIQAWWRGMMVRKHLGPFSNKKKSRKGKKLKAKNAKPKK